MHTKTTKLEKNDKFTINVHGHEGRVYKVVGFAPCKFGTRFAICDYSNKPGDTFLFSANDLNEYGAAFRMYDTTQRESDVEMFARVDAELKAKEVARESRRVLMFRQHA